MNIPDLAKQIGELRLRHPHYESALRRVKAQTLLMPEGHVIALVGPTRAGKTTLVTEVWKSLLPKSSSDSRIPALYIQVETTDRGKISTRYLFGKILRELKHPFHVGQEPIRAHTTETVIRGQLPPALKHRETRLLILDEAHHLLRERSKAAAGAALDSLKCLGNETEIQILLSGSYQLLTTCFASAHLNGRLSVINLPRYSIEGTQAEEFDRLLVTYDKLLPWARGSSLFRMRQFIYSGTLGCCGLISSWIQAALASMVAEGDTRLRDAHFRLTRFEQQLEEIRQEIAMGESLLTEVEPPVPVAMKSVTPRAKRRYPPGKRNPTRDKVGP